MENCLGLSFLFETAVHIYLCIYVQYIYIYADVSIYLHIYIHKMELAGNDNFHLFAANGKRKQQTSVCLLLTKTENLSLFSLIGKRLTVINDCCFSKRAHISRKYIQFTLLTMRHLGSKTLNLPSTKGGQVQLFFVRNRNSER
jgi:hypothetical protein